MNKTNDYINHILPIFVQLLYLFIRFIINFSLFKLVIKF